MLKIISALILAISFSAVAGTSKPAADAKADAAAVVAGSCMVDGKATDAKDEKSCTEAKGMWTAAPAAEATEAEHKH